MTPKPPQTDTTFAMKLNILTDILIKKKQAMTQIANICENQSLLLVQPPSDERFEMLKEISVEKQKLIEAVIECDDVFQTIFGEISGNFEEKAKLHKSQVTVLQDKIKQVMELDVKIRAYEERNKNVVTDQRPQPLDKNNPYTKNYLREQYEKHKKTPQDGGVE
jgi:adenylate kinase family enzyme